MIKHLILWYNKSVNAGTQKIQQPEVASRIRIMNTSLLVSAFFCLVLIPWGLFNQQPELVIEFGFGLLIIIISYLFTCFHQHVSGWHVILSLPAILIAILPAFFPMPPANLVFIIFLQTFSFVLFTRKAVFFAFLVIYIVSTIVTCYFMYGQGINNYNTDIVTNILILIFGLVLQILAVYLLQQERNKNEATLTESEIKFRSIFENNPVGIIIDDLKANRFKDVNKKALELFGYTYEEMINIRKENLTHPEDMNVDQGDFEKVNHGDLTYVDVEKRYVTKNGETLWARTFVALIKDENNEPQYNIVMIKNISEEKQQEQQIQSLFSGLQALNQELEEQVQERTESLQETYDALSRSNQDLEQFAHVASSDLREPLRMIGNFVQLLERRYSDKIDKNGREYISYAVDGVNRMSKLIQGLLQYAEVGQKDSHFEITNINDLVAAKLLDLNHFIKDKNATVNIAPLPDALTSEPIQLGVVFYNLIANGLKFNESSSPTIDVKAEEQESHWLFSVQDNGIGIQDEFKEKIFEVFKRLHSREYYEGSGIGLSVCKKIVYRHRGEIWLDSEIGKGTTFYFTIHKDIE